MATAQTTRHKPVAVIRKFRVTEHKFFLLFVYLIAVLLYYPYVKEDSFSYTVFRIVGSAGIFLAVYAVKVRRTLLICAVLLAIPAGLQRLLLFRADAGCFRCSAFFSALLSTFLSWCWCFAESSPNSR